MHFEENFTYHIYNRSNNTVFKTRENYLYFLKKFRHYILPYTSVLSWCLMPNHFHFLLIPNKKATKFVKEKHLLNTQVLSKQFGIFHSSYTKAFNKQNNRKGSLFSHNTKAIVLNEISNGKINSINNYAETCFRYIHQNPMKSNLVNNIEDWEFSSYLDYYEKRNGNLVNKELALEIINFDKDNFKIWSLANIKNVEKILK